MQSQLVFTSPLLIVIHVLSLIAGKNCENQRLDLIFDAFSGSIIDDSVDEEGSVVNEFDDILSGIYHRSEDNSSMIVKSMGV
jgi:hypothetical protein